MDNDFIYMFNELRKCQYELETFYKLNEENKIWIDKQRKAFGLEPLTLSKSNTLQNDMIKLDSILKDTENEQEPKVKIRRISKRLQDKENIYSTSLEKRNLLKNNPCERNKNLLKDNIQLNNVSSKKMINSTGISNELPEFNISNISPISKNNDIKSVFKINEKKKPLNKTYLKENSTDSNNIIEAIDQMPTQKAEEICLVNEAEVEKISINLSLNISSSRNTRQKTKLLNKHNTPFSITPIDKDEKTDSSKIKINNQNERGSSSKVTLKQYKSHSCLNVTADNKKKEIKKTKLHEENNQNQTNKISKSKENTKKLAKNNEINSNRNQKTNEKLRNEEENKRKEELTKLEKIKIYKDSKKIKNTPLKKKSPYEISKVKKEEEEFRQKHRQIKNDLTKKIQNKGDDPENKNIFKQHPLPKIIENKHNKANISRRNEHTILEDDTEKIDKKELKEGIQVKERSDWTNYKSFSKMTEIQSAVMTRFLNFENQENFLKKRKKLKTIFHRLLK